MKTKCRYLGCEQEEYKWKTCRKHLDLEEKQIMRTNRFKELNSNNIEQ